MFVDESARKVRELANRKIAAPDMSRELMELTLRAVCRTLFGFDASSQAETVGRAMQSLQKSLSRPEQIPDWLPIPGAGGSPKRSIAALDGVVYGLIRGRREELAKGADTRGNLLDALLTAVDVEGDGGGLSEKEIRDQLMTLFLAGHETTSHALTWTLYLLSQNPAAREAVLEETRSVLGDRPATMDDLGRLPLALQAIKEAMRLFPPAYMLARRAAEDVEIAGYAIPKGAEAIAWIYMTHRDPRWFDDPTAFRLDRFTEANERAMHPFAFVPFGAGPRACIGKAFALLEAHLMLVTLVQRFRFTLAPGQLVVPEPRITMHPKDGLRMQLERL
ncbi:MAG: cytochrome P450 [Polyangiaceae bacterium]